MQHHFSPLLLSLSIMLMLACSGASSQELADPTTNLQTSLPSKTRSQNERVRCAFEDRQGSIWFGTNYEGVYRFNGAQFDWFDLSNGVCNNWVNDIAEDKKGQLWFATASGLCMFDGKTFHTITIPWSENENLWGEGMNDNQVLSVVCDQSGNIWFGTWGGGAYCYDGNSFTSFLAEEGHIQEDGKHRNVIQSILIDHNHNLWFTSMTHGGITKRSGSELVHYSMDDGLLSDQFFSSFEDSHGNLWFGSLGNGNEGLLKMNGDDFEHFNTSRGLPNNNVISIAEDQQGKLWLASARGPLSVFDGTTFSFFTWQDQKTYEEISFVFQDSKGNMWFGGGYGKLYRFDGEEVVDFTEK